MNRFFVFLFLIGCSPAPQKKLAIKYYHLIGDGGDTLKIQYDGNQENKSKYELVAMANSIDSVISRLDSTAFKIGNSTFKLQVKENFNIVSDSTINVKAYYVSISDGKIENDYFGIYTSPIGTISLKAYERHLILRLYKIDGRNLNDLQELSDSVVLRHTW